MADANITIGIIPEGAVEGAKVVTRSLDDIYGGAEKTTKAVESMTSMLKGMLGDIRQNTVLVAASMNKDLVGSLQEVQTEVQKTKTTWGELSVYLNQTLELFKKVGGYGKEMFDFADGRAAIVDMGKVFHTVATEYGNDSLTMLGSMRRVTEGTVSDAQLREAATRTMRKGIATTTQEIAGLMEVAKAKSEEGYGKTMDIFEKMIQGIATGSKRALIPLGMFPEQVAKATSGVEQLVNAGDLMREVLEKGQEDIRLVAESGAGAGEAFEQFSVAVDSLKESFDLIVPALTPVVRELTELTQGLKDFLVQKGLLKDTSANPYLGVDSAKLQEMIDAEGVRLRKATEKEIILTKQNKQNEIIIDPDSYYPNMKAYEADILSMQKRAKEATFAIGQMKEALRMKTVLEENGWYQEGIREGLERQASAQGKVVEKAKEHKETARDIFAAYDGVGKIMEKMGKEGTDAAIAFTAALGGGVSFDLDGAVKASEEINRNLEEANQNALDAASEMKDLLGDFGDIVSDSLDDTEDGFKKIAEEDIPKAMANSIKTVETPLSRVFNDSLVEAFEGGDWEGALAKGLKRAWIEAVSNSITGAIFDQSGSISSVEGGGGSGGIFGSLVSGFKNLFRGGGSRSSGIGPDDVAQDGSGGSSSILGLSIGKGLSGALTGALAGAAVGYGINMLFGTGGVFGSKLIHGQESISQAGDINQQVTSAMTDRKQILGTVGLSDDTVKELRDLVFSTAGYTASESGNGWTSKKTTTYALDADSANTALAKYDELKAQAAVEVSNRELTIALTNLSRPFEALDMTMKDLEKAFKNTTDQETKNNILLQEAQLTKQKDDFWAGKQADWTSYLLANPMAGMGSGVNLMYTQDTTGGKITDGTYSKPSTIHGVTIGADGLTGGSAGNKVMLPLRTGDSSGGATGTSSGSPLAAPHTLYPNDIAGQNIQLGAWASGDYNVGGTKLTAEEFESWAGTQVQMGGLKNQAANQFDLQSQLSAGKKPWDLKIGDKSYMDILKDTTASELEIAKKLEDQIKNETLSMERRAQLFSEWQQAESAYYGTKNQILQLESEHAAAEKAKAESKRQDSLYSALTAIGETRKDASGNSVIIVQAQNSGNNENLQRIRDGLDPEGKALFDQIIGSTGGQARWNN